MDLLMASLTPNPPSPSSSSPLPTFLVGFLISLAALTAALLLLLRLRLPWCNCPVCYSYVTSSWSTQFPNLCDWLTHLLLTSPTRTVHIHVLSNTITANPLNVRHMLKTRFDNYPKGKAFSSILWDLLGRGIFNVDGPHWLFQRKLASLELGSVSVRSYAFRIVLEEIHHRLLPILRHQTDGPIDLQDVFRRFSFDTICKISFGLDPRCLDLSLPISEFAAAFDSASRLSAARATAVSPLSWRLKRLLNIGSERVLRNSIRLVDELAREVIRQRRLKVDSTSDDLLSRFIGSVSDDGYLRDIVVSFLLAGRDTVASCLTSLFYLLSDHPEVENAVIAEVKAVTKGVDAPVTWEQMKEMKYLQAVVYEGMRLYPPVQQDSKFAAGDDVLPCGEKVKKGTRVTFYPYAMGRLPEEWGEDCMEFKPERWMEDGEFKTYNAFKYPVFQAGLRICLGQEMAVMEAKVVVAEMVRRFHVRVQGGDGLRFVPGLTASIKGGLFAVVTSRKGQ